MSRDFPKSDLVILTWVCSHFMQVDDCLSSLSILPAVWDIYIFFYRHIISSLYQNNTYFPDGKFHSLSHRWNIGCNDQSCQSYWIRSTTLTQIKEICKSKIILSLHVYYCLVISNLNSRPRLVKNPKRFPWYLSIWNHLKVDP